jgi:hypothetical protein
MHPLYSPTKHPNDALGCGERLVIGFQDSIHGGNGQFPPGLTKDGLTKDGLHKDRPTYWMCQRQSCDVPLPHIHHVPPAVSDISIVRELTPIGGHQEAASVPWAMQMRAISLEEPCRLIYTLTGAILGCGGWVLSRGSNDSGAVSMLFEFERQVCVDIYTVLIASGLELSRNGHIRFTELCQCTRLRPKECGDEIASIDLEIQTYPADMPNGSLPPRLE